MKLEHPVSFARLGMFVVAAVIIAHVGALIVDLASDWLQRRPSTFIFMRDMAVLGEWPTLLRYLWARLISYDMYKDIILAIAVAYIATPLCFVLLPVTMSRAKVRAAHIVRIAAYSIGLLAAGAILGRVVIAIRDLNGVGRWTWGAAPPRREYFWTPTLDWLTDRYLEGGNGVACFGAVCLILLGTFWWCALTRYLKLPQPRLTAIVLVLVGFLVAFVAGFTLSPERMEWCLRGIW